MQKEISFTIYYAFTLFFAFFYMFYVNILWLKESSNIFLYSVSTNFIIIMFVYHYLVYFYCIVLEQRDRKDIIFLLAIYFSCERFHILKHIFNTT